MREKSLRAIATAAAVLSSTSLTVVLAGTASAFAAATDYRFELAGSPQLSSGKDILQVRLVHLPDRKPVADAVIFESRADMGPSGMVTMTAPIKVLPSTRPGEYRFEVEPSASGSWAITLAAKVQGEAETIHGSVTAELAK